MGQARVIDGRSLAAGLRQQATDIAAHIRGEIGVLPGLATVLVGDDPASQSYVRAKGRCCTVAGVAAFDIRLPVGISEAELVAEVQSVAGAITPVPGGVGPMTIACLLLNTLSAASGRRGLPEPLF